MQGSQLDQLVMPISVAVGHKNVEQRPCKSWMMSSAYAGRYALREDSEHINLFHYMHCESWKILDMKFKKIIYHRE